MEIKEGDLLCDLHYFKVTKITDMSVFFKDTNTGEEWSIPPKFIDAALKDTWSSDRYSREETLCRHQVVGKLLDAGVRPFSVEFVKSNGEDRTIRGSFIKGEPVLGRSTVYDLDKEDNNIRLVDHRTIKSLILDGVKYIVGSN